MRRLVLLLACALAAAAPGRAATLEVGANKPYPLPSAAAAAAHDGDTIVIAAGTYTDCAVLKARNLTIRGAGPDATVLTGKVCQGKAILVADGDNLTVQDLALTGAHDAEFNGAGIRAEGGNMTVRHVRFAGNEDGILSAPLPDSTITVLDSRFIGNGSCEGSGCAHGIYAARVKLLRVVDSTFRGTRHGHHIKSRAERTEVIGCHFADGPDGTSSYAVEIPNGGAVVLRGTTIEKGPKSENHTAALTIGSEGVNQPTPEITVENNDFTVDGTYSSFLVNNLTATAARLVGNTLHGNARPLRGDGTVR